MKTQCVRIVMILLEIALVFSLSPLAVQATPPLQTAADSPPSNEPPKGYTPTPSTPLKKKGAAEGGADILLVQTALPWDSDANTQVLSALGYAYDIVDMGNIAQVDLFRYPVILIVNDQVQAFYDQYANQIAAFENYVASGGTLVFFASSDGWALGTLHANLPGGVAITTPWYESNNYIVNAAHPIVSAELSDGNALVDADLYSDYCSHGYFSALPDNASVILRESHGYPTLVEYEMGQGRVIASTLTWEHNWAYRNAFGRKALDDVFLHAFSSSGVVDGIINVFPNTVPADGATLVNVTLAGATPGHRVRLISDRMSIDTFANATGVANNLGRFVTTLRSTTAGTAVLTAQDLTTGQTFPASTSVNFTAVGGGNVPPGDNGAISIVDVKAHLPLSGWYPAINTSFLQSIFGHTLHNSIEVVVDWRGSTPKRVDFILNGKINSVPASDQKIYYTVDMGQHLRLGPNELRIVAYNVSNEASQTIIYYPVSWEVPNWLGGLLQDANAVEIARLNQMSQTLDRKTPQPWFGVEVEYDVPSYSLDIWFKVPPKTLLSRVYVPVGQFETPGVQAFARLRIKLEERDVELRAGARYLSEYERRRAAGFQHKGLSILGTEFTGDAYLLGRAYFLDLFVLQPEAVGGGVELEISKTWERTWLALLYLAGLPDPTPALSSIPVVGQSVANFVARVASGYITLEGRGGAELTYQLAPMRRFDTLDLKLGSGIEIGMQADIGVAKIKGLYGGDADATFLCLRNVAESSLSTNLFCDLVLKTGGGMEIEAFGSKLEVLVFPSFEKHWPETQAASLNTMANSAIFTQTNWQLIPHSLTPDYAVFRAKPATAHAFKSPFISQNAAEFLTPQNTITSVLVSNVYTYTEPTLASNPANGQALVLWTHDDINKPVGQAHEIAFSRWDGAAWSTPAGVTNDDRLDSAPQVAWAGDGKAIAVWQRLNALLSPSATLDLTTTRKVEIATATYDPATNQWSPVALLTNNQVLEMTPTLARNRNGNVLAVWRQNEAGLLGGDAANPDRISAAFYQNGWGTPHLAVDGIPGLVDLAAGVGNDQAMLAYTQYLAATGSVTPTLQLFTSTWNGATWSAPVQRTNDPLGHRTPQVIYTAANEPVVVWLAGHELRMQNLASGAVTALALPATVGTIDEFRVIQDATGNVAAVFTAQSGQRDLFVAFYDQAHQLWGLPTPLTADRNAESYPAPALSADGRLLLAYAATAVTSVARTMTTQAGETIQFTVPTEGQTDLMTLAHSFVRNVTLQEPNFTVSNEHPAPGESVTLAAIVTNTGALALDQVSVTFYDGDPALGGAVIGSSILAAPLATGFPATLTTSYVAPAGGGVRQIYAVVDANNAIAEANEADNRVQRALFGPDLALTSVGVHYWGGNAIDLISQIHNLGTTASPTATIAYYQDAAGTTLALTDTIPAISAGAQVTLTTPWHHPALASGSHALFALVNPLAMTNFAEVYRENNVYTATLQTGADLMLSPYALQTTALTATTAAFTVTLANIGNAPAAASLVKLYRRGDLASRYVVAAVPAPSLAPGQTAVLVGEVTGPLGCGLYVLANPEQVIQEISQANNLIYAPAPGGQCASFYNTPNTAIAPATVVFTDTSTGSNDAWLWAFGDGTTSTEQQPSHQYAERGSYTVTLTVNGPAGTDSYSLPNAVRVYQPAQADFTAGPVTGKAPLQVSFADHSTGDRQSWLWDFGDGNSSVEQNPVHNYTAAGIYAVTLTVSGYGGTSTMVKREFITVTPTPATVLIQTTPSIITADGVSTTSVEVTVQSNNGEPITGEGVHFEATLGSITSLATTNINGVATALLTSATKTGNAIVTATAGNVQQATQVQFVAGPPATIAQIDRLAILADGVSTLNIGVTVRDAHNNAVEGQRVEFSTTMGTITGDATTNALGVATATFTAPATPGAAVVTAKAGTVTQTFEITLLNTQEAIFLPLIRR